MNDSKRSQVNSAISLLKTMQYQLQALELEGEEVASGRLSTLNKEVDAAIDIVKKVISSEGLSKSNVPENLRCFWLSDYGHVGDLHQALQELESCKQSISVLQETLKKWGDLMFTPEIDYLKISIHYALSYLADAI